MKNIFLIRHGQSEANVNTRGLLSKEKKYVIDSSFDITEEGKKQVLKTALKILEQIEGNKPKEKSYTMFVSPFKRTRNTAAVLQDALEGNIVIDKKIEDPRLVEQDFGDFDFQYRDEWKKISPHSYRINQARFHDNTGRFFARLENGENLLDVYNRVSLFATTRLERELLRSNTQNYIIVTHANTMRVLKMYLENLPVEEYTRLAIPENAGGYHFTYNEDTGEYEYIKEI